MKTISKALFFLFLVCGIALSADAKSVKADRAPNVDFSQFTTYKFVGWEKGSSTMITQFDKQRIENEFKAALEARGLTMVGVTEEADLDVALFLAVDDKTTVTAYTTYVGGLGYPRSYWGGWGYGYGYGYGGVSYADTEYEEDDYKEGTLVVDIFGKEPKELIFQGVIQEIVQEDPQRRAKQIKKNIRKVMKMYPVKKQK